MVISGKHTTESSATQLNWSITKPAKRTEPRSKPNQERKPEKKEVYFQNLIFRSRIIGLVFEAFECKNETGREEYQRKGFNFWKRVIFVDFWRPATAPLIGFHDGSYEHARNPAGKLIRTLEREQRRTRDGEEKKEKGGRKMRKKPPHLLFIVICKPVRFTWTEPVWFLLQGPMPQLLRKPISILFHSAPPVMLLTPPCIHIFVSLSFISSCIFFTALFFRRISFYFCVCISYLAQHIYFISFIFFLIYFIFCTLECQ